MKRLLLIPVFICTTLVSVFAQDDASDTDTARVRDKMMDYIQLKLNLSQDESKKFRPAFIKYFKDWRQTIRENRKDRVLMRQKIGDLQLKYRDQFKDIIGEKKSNEVFLHQRKFIEGVRGVRENRLKKRT